LAVKDKDMKMKTIFARFQKDKQITDAKLEELLSSHSYQHLPAEVSERIIRQINAMERIPESRYSSSWRLVMTSAIAMVCFMLGSFSAMTAFKDNKPKTLMASDLIEMETISLIELF